MGRNCPLQRAQPFGGKLNETTLISLRNGSDILPPVQGGGEWVPRGTAEPCILRTASPAGRAAGGRRHGCYSAGGWTQAEPAGTVLRKPAPPAETLLACAPFVKVFR